MAGITTHVLDTGKGRPAQGVRVTLSIFRDDWNEVARGVTDADGRLRTLTDGVELQRATYRLTFETAAYGNTFFPEVSIVFQVENPGTHHHVPLLLSPFGYSTYRGS
jgi:5-hydroxyisourate hydrolase